MQGAWWPLNRRSLDLLWQYLYPGHTEVTPKWFDCKSGVPPIPSSSPQKNVVFHSLILSNYYHFYWSLLIIYTGQSCSDLCFWIHCLSLVLVPQGNSFILTQFYKSNRKITGSEIISIVRETGPLVFWVIVSSLADRAGRNDGLKWPRSLSSQVSAKAVSRKSNQEANPGMVIKMCRKVWIVLLVRGNVTYLEIFGANWVVSKPPCKRSYLFINSFIQKVQTYT